MVSNAARQLAGQEQPLQMPEKKTYRQPQHLQDVQTQISKAKSSNTSSQQEIAELTSQSHLKSAAHKYGLTDKNSNVRNVNK